MRASLASPRLRRRAAGLGLALVVAGMAFAVAWIGGGDGPGPGLSGSEPQSQALAPAPAVEREVPFTEALRAEVVPVASRFVATAVERKRLDEAWSLVTPSLRSGYTRDEWRTGEIPVVPYPVGSARWDVQYALENEVALYVLLAPRAGADVDPTTFILVLERAREGKPWRVSEWTPSAASAVPMANEELPGGRALAAVEPGGAFDQGNLSPLFLLLPVGGTVGLVLAVAAFFVLRGWRRNRRAAAAYGARGLPELPARYRSSS